jgi:hypothetical protein
LARLELRSPFGRATYIDATLAHLHCLAQGEVDSATASHPIRNSKLHFRIQPLLLWGFIGAPFIFS